MRILTTLLALLLASPVFAETWVCSNVNDDQTISTSTYTRTADGFSSSNLHFPIVYEDENFLVLIQVRTDSTLIPLSEPPDMPGYRTFLFTDLVRIQKFGDHKYSHNAIHGNGIDWISGRFEWQGTCTVVE